MHVAQAVCRSGGIDFVCPGGAPRQGEMWLSASWRGVSRGYGYFWEDAAWRGGVDWCRLSDPRAYLWNTDMSTCGCGMTTLYYTSVRRDVRVSHMPYAAACGSRLAAGPNIRGPAARVVLQRHHLRGRFAGASLICLGRGPCACRGARIAESRRIFPHQSDVSLAKWPTSAAHRLHPVMPTDRIKQITVAAWKRRELRRPEKMGRISTQTCIWRFRCL